MTTISQYRIRALAGSALALAGFSFGVTSSGVNGKTIVAGLLWVAGLLIALRARKLLHDAELEDAKVEYYSQGHRDGGVDAGIERMNRHCR